MVTRMTWIVFFLVLKPTHQAVDIDRIVMLLSENPRLRSPLPSNLPIDQFRVWERFEERDDGLPYFDYNFDRSHPTHHEEKRDTAILTTPSTPISTNDTSTTASPRVSGAEIDVTNFACNVLAKHWVCSRPDAPFCVFYASGVPASKRVIVSSMAEAVNASSPADQRLLNFKCGNKLRVTFISETF